MEEKYMLTYEITHKDGVVDRVCMALKTEECARKAEKHLIRMYGWADPRFRMLGVKMCYLQVATQNFS